MQMSAVLQHVRKHRPDWIVDYQAQDGQHQVGRGIAHSTFAYGDPYPVPHYDAEVLLLLFDTWANWGDRPNTRVSSCLHERFGLPWDAECGRYRVNISLKAKEAGDLLFPIEWPVAIHYQGDSSQDRKNLTDAQADAICEEVVCLGRDPVILDARNRSPLLFERLTRYPGWDAEMNCAIISRCEAFVGIDSGPSKCASATDTPALVVWTGHHPAPFHDPAPNTTHLVPEGYHGLDPVCNNEGVVRWFEEHYNVRTYRGNPVGEVQRWLGEVLT